MSHFLSPYISDVRLNAIFNDKADCELGQVIGNLFLHGIADSPLMVQRSNKATVMSNCAATVANVGVSFENSAATIGIMVTVISNIAAIM